MSDLFNDILCLPALQVVNLERQRGWSFLVHHPKLWNFILGQNCMAKFFVTLLEMIVIVELSSFATLLVWSEDRVEKPTKECNEVFLSRRI